VERRNFLNDVKRKPISVAHERGKYRSVQEGVRYDNCMKDESRSLEGGLQEQASNHLKRL